MPSEAEQESCSVGIDIEGHFSGLAKQSMKFHNGIAELIDNAISANIKDKEYFSKEEVSQSFRIQIDIQRYRDHVDVIVADSGEGMSPEMLRKDIWTSGDTSNADGVLNEHGFGLKNALSFLTRNQGSPPFKILSRNNTDYGENEYGKVEGPISNDMMRELGDFRSGWEKGSGTLSDPDVGTRVHLRTSNEILQSSYRKATKLSTISNALREHFGVIYRHFLDKTDRNHLSITWKDHVTGESGEDSVKPIYPEFKTGQDEDGNEWYRTDEIAIENQDGDQYSVKYKRGIVDWEATREKYEQDSYDGIGTSSGESPFKIYYRNNQPTQGVDIVYNGRTLKTGVIEDIWDRATHNKFNRFIGEIILSDEAFETVNNKVDINENSSLWIDLKNKLNNKDQFSPIKYGETEREQSIKKRLKRKLEAEVATESVREEKGFDGVNVDLFQEFEEDYEYIYEVKRGGAEPINVYQCVMYWDSYSRVEDSELRKVILVAREISDNAASMIDRWNERQDENGDEYNIEFQPLSKYDLE